MRIPALFVLLQAAPCPVVSALSDSRIAITPDLTQRLMMLSIIFITGSTGFIGSQTLQDTLQAGHRIRLSIRREGQVDEVKKRFPDHVSQLEFVLIPDIGDRTALRAALKNDVDYIFHLASPMPGKGQDFKTEYLTPAVNGMEAILNAAAEAPSVKRVVIMSSLLALIPLGGLQIPGLEIKDE